MQESRGKGYSGYSMSVNARLAYANAEKPLSKWRKADFLEVAEELEMNLDLFKMLTLDLLKYRFLTYTCHHHTSKHFNYTSFYEINFDSMSRTTDEDMERWIADHKKLLEDTKEERQAQAERKAKQRDERAKEKAHLEELHDLFAYQDKYKTINGFIRATENGRIDLDKIKAVRQRIKLERLEMSVLSGLGQIRKAHGYSKASDMLDDLKAGNLSADILDSTTRYRLEELLEAKEILSA